MKAEEAKESTMIEMEAKRLAKMQRRQQKEIEQLLALNEDGTNTGTGAKKACRRMKDEKNEVLRRQKIKAEEQRMKALKRQAEEELEEKKRRALANQQYLKGAVNGEKTARQDTNEARKEAERIRKAEERRQETAKILKHKPMLLRQD